MLSKSSVLFSENTQYHNALLRIQTLDNLIFFLTHNNLSKEYLYLLKKNLQNYILDFLQSLIRVQFIVLTLALLFTFKLAFECT
jgi:hypothetical protein